MPDREFLEKYPLYRKFRVDLPATLEELSKPAVHMYCTECESYQTFAMARTGYTGYDEIPGNPGYQGTPCAGFVASLVYRCASCYASDPFRSGPPIRDRHFLIKFDPDGKYVMKVGQEPPWDVSVAANTRNGLGEHADEYRKGLICESQGYGVGAFAYYRRIVEEVLDRLLDDIMDFVPEDSKQSYQDALDKVRGEHVAEKKIDVVKGLLPASLRPGGMNPLSTLHSTLSEGIHTSSDEDCLGLAEALRFSLEFLVEQVVVHKLSSGAYEESMKRLHGRK